MRVLTDKTTGRILEAQDGDDPEQLDVLYANAEAAGLAREACEARVIPAAEFAARLAAQAEADLSYRDRRARDYPPLGEQLDALWHAMAAGLLAPVPGFYDPIAAVKARHPKPE